MTMDITSTEVQYLTGSLLEKQEPVTYRTLSRELQIHHANAKRILYEFYVANKDKVYAKFIVTGYNEKGETTIQLLDENSVFLQLSLPLPFKEVHTIHIYCLVKRGLSISDIQISIHEHKFPLDYTKLEEYYKNGVIRVPKLEAVEVSNVPARAQPKAEPRTVQPAPNSSKLTPTTPSSGLTSGYVSRKAQVKKPVTADITSKYTSRKQSTPPATSVSSATGGYQYKSRKAEKLQPKERVIVSNDGAEDIEEIPAETAKKAPAVKSEELQKLFEDDDSDFSENETQDKVEPIVVEAKEEEKEEEKKDVDGKVEVVEDVEDVEVLDKKAVPATDKAASEPEAEVESYVDEDGYLVTVNKTKKPSPPPVSTSRASAKRSTPPASSSKDPKKKKTGQSSLMSFFKPK